MVFSIRHGLVASPVTAGTDNAFRVATIIADAAGNAREV